MVLGMKVDKNVEMGVDWTLAVGGVNWGLSIIGDGINVVEMLLSGIPMLEMAVYGIIGVAGLYKILDLLGM